jgi:hypothetical protein
MKHTLKPLTNFMFLACTRFNEYRPATDFVKALDESGYFGNKQFTPEEKLAHVQDKLDNMRMPKGLMARYRLEQRLLRYEAREPAAA